ncbi:preprotein translocase subunit SecY [Candidatus Parcubacteria bacterium]|nr:MAG: preprotein translocase subunit SecY [Candidatus Parcubacteria bacterium]
MLSKVLQFWKVKDLRNSVIYILAMLIIFRVAANIPVPGVNAAALRDFFNSNQLMGGLINIFSVGGMENFSVVALGVAPYITASIIFQLLIMIIPQLEEIAKEGEAGQRKINQWTRYLTVPLAALQGYGMIALLRQSQFQILGDINAWSLFTIIVTVTGGTIFLVWIGELISEKKIGNGISILIFVGIVSRIPSVIRNTLITFDKDQIINLLIFAAIALVTIIGVVIINEGQRNIPVSYARRVRGMKMYGGVETHLPLRVNQAGVIPIIFAISIVLFPPMIARFFLRARTDFIVSAAQWVIALFDNQVFYGIAYFLLVFGFTYFYTAVIFHPDQIAENLQKQGGFIPGIRPGKNTAEYLQQTSSRILLAGALFLGLIAILPLLVRSVTGTVNLVIGGTSILIVVSVVIEIVQQIQSQLTMRDYEGI